MNFGEAIERVKTRSYIARCANWDDDVFIFEQVPADINEETVKQKSLKESFLLKKLVDNAKNSEKQLYLRCFH